MLLTVDLDKLELGPGKRLLDLGCGEGRHCFGALDYGVEVVGLDLDETSLARAAGALRFRADDARHRATFLCGTAFSLPFPDRCFDAAICAEVMEHVHDVDAAAAELARVLQPGARCAVTVPTATSEILYRHLGDAYFESPGGHIRIFSPRKLARILARAGLLPTGVGFAHGFHTPYWALRSLVGLEGSGEHPWVRAYGRVLLRATQSPILTWVETQLLDRLCPKSMVLYTRRAKTGPGGGAS